LEVEKNYGLICLDNSNGIIPKNSLISFALVWNFCLPATQVTEINSFAALTGTDILSRLLSVLLLILINAFFCHG
jgi:hypothetical protein